MTVCKEELRGLWDFRSFLPWPGWQNAHVKTIKLPLSAHYSNFMSKTGNNSALLESMSNLGTLKTSETTAEQETSFQLLHTEFGLILKNV